MSNIRRLFVLRFYPKKSTISETMQANFYAAKAVFGKGFYKY